MVLPNNLSHIKFWIGIIQIRIIQMALDNGQIEFKLNSYKVSYYLQDFCLLPIHQDDLFY